MVFKMKGPSIHQGTARHRSALKDKQAITEEIYQASRATAHNKKHDSGEWDKDHKTTETKSPAKQTTTGYKCAVCGGTRAEHNRPGIVGGRHKYTMTVKEKKGTTETKSPAKDTKSWGIDPNTGGWDKDWGEKDSHNKKHESGNWDKDHKTKKQIEHEKEGGGKGMDKELGLDSPAKDGSINSTHDADYQSDPVKHEKTMHKVGSNDVAPEKSPAKQGFIWDEEIARKFKQMQRVDESNKDYKKRLKDYKKEGTMSKKEFKGKKKDIRQAKQRSKIDKKITRAEAKGKTKRVDKLKKRYHKVGSKDRDAKSIEYEEKWKKK